MATHLDHAATSTNLLTETPTTWAGTLTEFNLDRALDDYDGGDVDDSWVKAIASDVLTYCAPGLAVEKAALAPSFSTEGAKARLATAWPTVVPSTRSTLPSSAQSPDVTAARADGTGQIRGPDNTKLVKAAVKKSS